MEGLGRGIAGRGEAVAEGMTAVASPFVTGLQAAVTAPSAVDNSGEVKSYLEVLTALFRVSVPSGVANPLPAMIGSVRDLAACPCVVTGFQMIPVWTRRSCGHCWTLLRRGTLPPRPCRISCAGFMLAGSCLAAKPPFHRCGMERCSGSHLALLQVPCTHVVRFPC